MVPTSDEHETARDYRIATSVLEAMVKGCLGHADRVRLAHGSGLMRARSVEVIVDGGSCHVTLPLEARFGEVLHALAAEVQDEVRRCVAAMTGLEVEAVDIIYTGVYPIADAE